MEKEPIGVLTVMGPPVVRDNEWEIRSKFPLNHVEMALILLREIST